MTAQAQVPSAVAQKATALLALKQAKEGKLDLLTWTALYRKDLRAGVKFDLRNHSYMIDIFKYTGKELVVYKASQMGASEYAISAALYSCDVLAATCLYVFPTVTHISDFSSARVSPAVEASPYLQSIVTGFAPDAQGVVRSDKKTDRVTLKRIRDNFLYLRGGTVSPYGNAPQLKSIDADVVFLDEVDEMDARVVPLAEKRLGHSSLGYMRYISTPTYANVGIHAVYETSDAREWFVPCDKCGHRQFLTMNHIITEWDGLERPIDWHGRDEQRAYVACEKCGRELDRLARGEWIASFANRERAGFHLSRIFSPQADLLSMVLSLRNTDETARKEAFNQDWGLPYKPRGGQLTDEVLDDCIRPYTSGSMSIAEATFMGIDVGSVLHVVIRGPQSAETGERRLRTAMIVDRFKDAAELMRMYNVRRCVVDMMPEVRAARDFQNMFSAGRVLLANFRDLSREVDAIHLDAERFMVEADRTRALDSMLAGFYLRESVLPADIKSLSIDYYPHLKALTRVVEPGRSGRETARYISSTADHYAFAELYTHIASYNMRATVPGVVGARGIKGWGVRS